MYSITQLNNGLTIATAAMPHMASVSVGIWVGVGSRYEAPEMNGVCHFIEHLLFKGTNRRSAKEISQAVEGIGGYLNAFTSEELTCFHARGHADYFADLLDVLADMFLHSQFAPGDLAKEREVIKEEIAMYLDQPHQHVQELLNATLWPDQPLGRSITGTPATLDAIRREQLVGWLRTNYVAGSTLIAVTGKINRRQVLKAVSRYAAQFPAGPRPRFMPSRNEQAGPRVSLHAKPTEQTQLALGIRTCSRHDGRRYALRLLNAILGENMSSRLFQVIREDRGLAYSIYSAPSFFADTGDLVISAGLDPDNLERTLRLIASGLRRLRETPVDAAELRRARDYAIGQIDLSLESTENQMSWIGEQWLGDGRVLSPGATKGRLRRVTAADIRAVARDFFRPERMNLALVSPRQSSRGLARLLMN